MSWGILDEILKFWRAGKIKKLVPTDSIVCDIGCGMSGNLLKTLSPYILKKELVSIKKSYLLIARR